MVSTTQFDINNTTVPVPRRLTFIYCTDYCQFCENPKGHVICHFISLNDNFGFLSCNKCSSVAEKATADWIEQYAYGPAKILVGKKIRVRRSSGTIEDDWCLDTERKLVQVIGGDKCVSCLKPGTQICKYVKITDLLEMNSPDVATA